MGRESRANESHLHLGERRQARVKVGLDGKPLPEVKVQTFQELREYIWTHFLKKEA